MERSTWEPICGSTVDGCLHSKKSEIWLEWVHTDKRRTEGRALCEINPGGRVARDQGKDRVCSNHGFISKRRRGPTLHLRMIYFLSRDIFALETLRHLPQSPTYLGFHLVLPVSRLRHLSPVPAFLFFSTVRSHTMGRSIPFLWVLAILALLPNAHLSYAQEWKQRQVEKCSKLLIRKEWRTLKQSQKAEWVGAVKVRRPSSRNDNHLSTTDVANTE